MGHFIIQVIVATPFILGAYGFGRWLARRGKG